MVLQAKEENKQVAILNIGPTRADHLVDLKISSVAGEVLKKVSLTWIVTFVNSNGLSVCPQLFLSSFSGILQYVSKYVTNLLQVINSFY